MNNTAKFYTHEEAIVMMEEMINDNWLDYDSIFSEDVIEDIVEDVVISDFQKLTLELLTKEEAILEAVNNKTVKKSSGGVTYEVNGVDRVYSFNFINQRNLNNERRQAEELIKQYKEDLRNSGYKFK